MVLTSIHIRQLQFIHLSGFRSSHHEQFLLMQLNSQFSLALFIINMTAIVFQLYELPQVIALVCILVVRSQQENRQNGFDTNNIAKFIKLRCTNLINYLQQSHTFVVSLQPFSSLILLLFHFNLSTFSYFCSFIFCFNAT